MRVIQEYWQCVLKKEVSIKEILDTIDAFLQAHEFAYRRLWSPTHPELSAGELKTLFRKIPRPCNPSEAVALFEDVRWFGEDVSHTDYTGKQPYLSNGVYVVHCAGTGFCHVHFYIEVTDPACPVYIREESGVIAALKERFPKVRRENTYCLWSPEETVEIEAAKAAISPRIAALKQSLCPFRERTGNSEEWGRTLKLIEQYAKGEKTAFSGKKLALAVFPKPLYHNRHMFGSCFEMVRRTPHGHKLTISFDSTPPAYVWQSGTISLSGIRFHVPLFREQICRESQETVGSFMEHCRLLAEQAEEALDEPLYEAFGASPDWWFEE